MITKSLSFERPKCLIFKEPRSRIPQPYCNEECSIGIVCINHLKVTLLPNFKLKFQFCSIYVYFFRSLWYRLCNVLYSILCSSGQSLSCVVPVWEGATLSQINSLGSIQVHKSHKVQLPSVLPFTHILTHMVTDHLKALWPKLAKYIEL